MYISVGLVSMYQLAASFSPETMFRPSPNIDKLDSLANSTRGTGNYIRAYNEDKCFPLQFIDSIIIN